MNARRRRRWWQDAVFYEIYIRSFQDSDGDGIGDLDGIAARVDYLVALGIDAVWITPFYPSPMADFGYDVADYCDVDPVFGSLASFDRLREALKARGIRTVLDFVPNHTSDRHPWFVESRASRRSARRDWYLWRDPAPGGGPPNNWLSQAGGPAWTLDPATGQYYLHSFLPQQPDLNWRNPKVRRAMLDAMRFWLDRGVDGFRVDVIQGLLKDPDFRDDPPNPHYRPGDPAYMTLDPVNSSNRLEVLEIAAAMRAVLSTYPGDRVLIGEVYRPVETLVDYYGGDLGGIELPFNFNLMWLDWIPEGVMRLVRTYERGLPAGAWPTWVIGNHDQPRVATRLGAGQARVAMMLILTLRGTPTLYQGDELGMTDVAVPVAAMRDPFAAAGARSGRDPQRAPMPWSATPGRGFTTGVPWLPLPGPGCPVSADAQAVDPASMLALCKAILRLRRGEPALTHGAWRGVSAEDGVLVYERYLGPRWCRIALNMRPATARLRMRGTGEVVVSTHGPGFARGAGEELDLAPDEGVIILPKRPSASEGPARPAR